jgi:hypothetical protein
MDTQLDIKFGPPTQLTIKPGLKRKAGYEDTQERLTRDKLCRLQIDSEPENSTVMQDID